MDPNIFRPLQARGQASSNVGAAIPGSLTSVHSSIKKRQEEISSILDALAMNNPEDAAAVKDSLTKRKDSTSDEASALLAAETAGEEEVDMKKRELDDEELQRRKIVKAYAAVAKLAIFEPEDAQLAKAFIPPLRKRQASKVTVTTTTTVPPVS
jgi:hypothetical protein